MNSDEGLAELLPMYLAERDFAPAIYALAQIHPELIEDLERGGTLEGRKALREKYANGQRPARTNSRIEEVEP